MIHVVIQTERRTAPRELAISIPVTEQTGTDAEGLPIYVQTGVQLHSMGTSVTDLNDPQILYAAEWDMVSPYIAVLKGGIADLKLAYAGWPMVEQEPELQPNEAPQ